MRKSLLLTLALYAVLAVSASASELIEIPAEFEPASAVVADYVTDTDGVGFEEIVPGGNARDGLAAMPVERRSNSEIELELWGDRPEEAVVLSHKIEEAWNAGDHEAALALFDDLGRYTDLTKINVANSWRMPLATQNAEKWGTDVRVGSRDSVYTTAMDIHHETGNLLAVTVWTGDGWAASWGVNISIDGGEHWMETETYNTPYYPWSCIAATIVGDRFYVTYPQSDTGVNIRQFSVSNGSSVGSYKKVFVPGVGGTDELVMASNQDYDDLSHRVYVAAITGSKQLRVFWDDEEVSSWSELATGVTDADRGLDICINEGGSNYFMFASYISTGDSLQIAGIHPFGIWYDKWSRPVGSSSPDMTSIGAWNDTVHCFHEFSGSRSYCRYYVSYDGGDAWLFGAAQDTSTTSESPAVCAREGGGVYMVHRYYTNPREGRVVWRDYGGLWSDPDEYSDVAPYWNQPSLVPMPGGGCGVLYLSLSSPTRGAFFDFGGGGCCTGPSVGNVDGSADNLVTMGDLTTMIDHLFISLTPLECVEEGNVDMSVDGLVTMGDLTVLIDHLFISLDPLPPCP